LLELIGLQFDHFLEFVLLLLLLIGWCFGLELTILEELLDLLGGEGFGIRGIGGVREGSIALEAACEAVGRAILINLLHILILLLYLRILFASPHPYRSLIRHHLAGSHINCLTALPISLFNSIIKLPNSLQPLIEDDDPGFALKDFNFKQFLIGRGNHGGDDLQTLSIDEIDEIFIGCQQSSFRILQVHEDGVGFELSFHLLLF
jgi:hypothetical protein